MNNMLYKLIISLAFVQASVAHATYGSVLAEQLSQYCAAQCHTTRHNSTAPRIGKAGPMGPQGVAGPRGAVGQPGPIGPRGLIGPSGSVDYTMVDEIVKKHVDKVLTTSSCSVVRQLWSTSEGVFDTYSPSIGKRIKLYCDQNTDGGNWTVFQRRIDGSETFQRNWNEYVSGFGSLYGEFWLGLENLHHLTSEGRFELRVDLRDWEGNTAYAVYSAFSVGDASSKYRLSVGAYSGTAGDSLTYHGNMRFTTVDQDNDGITTENCANGHKGGWWFKSCDHANLNGIYHNGGKFSGNEDGVEWHFWKNTAMYSMKFAEMKFRPI